MDELEEEAGFAPPREILASPAATPVMCPWTKAIERLSAWWAACQAWGIAGTGWLPLAIAIGWAPGLMAWPLLAADSTPLLENQLARSDRMNAILGVGSSLLVLGAFYLIVARRARGAWPDALRAWNERLLPILFLPLIPSLLVPGVESKRPWSVIAIAAAGAALVAVSVYRRPWRLPALPRWLPGAVAFALAAGWVLKMSLLAIAQHHGMETEVYDLGIYDSIFWNSIHGKPLATAFVRGGNHVSGHVDPILVLLSPLYLIYPRAELILVLQVVWVAAGAVPVWLLARRLLGSGYALALVVVYLLLPSLHGRTLYHFHSLTLAGPLLLWCLACLELKWLRAFWLPLALLLLTREDMALVACLIGAYAIVGKGNVRLGISTIAIAIAYLAFVKLAVMPDSKLLGDGSSESYGFAYYYKDMIPDAKEGTVGLLFSLLANPAFVLHHLITEAKLRSFALLFLPLLFLPFVAPRGKLLLSYGLVFMFLASREPVFSIAFQYPTVLDSLALGVAVIALAETGRLRLGVLGSLDPSRARAALAAAMVVATIVLSAKFGALLPSTSFRAGFHKLVREPTAAQQERYGWVRDVVERIGPTASVSASGRLGPHVSNRSKAYLWPNVRDADFLLLDRNRLKGKSVQKLRDLEKAGKYRTVDRHGSYQLLERSDRLGPKVLIPAAERRAILPGAESRLQPSTIGAENR